MTPQTDSVQEFMPDLQTWLAGQAAERKLTWLLAHADDGVIWGRYDPGNQTQPARLVLSGDQDLFPLVSPPLRLETLQQCRLFGETGELIIWRDDQNWHMSWQAEDLQRLRLEEKQILWGTEVAEEHPHDFSLLTERVQNGLKHTPPLIITSAQAEAGQVRLLVYHYINQDQQTGEARIENSRLVKVYIEPDAQERGK